MTEIGKCSLNPAITPASILLRNAYHECGKFGTAFVVDPDWCSIVLLGEQFPITPTAYPE
jgi:hypothetical protein